MTKILFTLAMLIAAHSIACAEPFDSLRFAKSISPGRTEYEHSFIAKAVDLALRNNVKTLTIFGDYHDDYGNVIDPSPTLRKMHKIAMSTRGWSIKSEYLSCLYSESFGPVAGAAFYRHFKLEHNLKLSDCSARTTQDLYLARLKDISCIGINESECTLVIKDIYSSLIDDECKYSQWLKYSYLDDYSSVCNASSVFADMTKRILKAYPNEEVRRRVLVNNYGPRFGLALFRYSKQLASIVSGR